MPHASVHTRGRRRGAGSSRRGRVLLALTTIVALAVGCDDPQREGQAQNQHDEHGTATPDAAVDMGLGTDPPFEWMGVFALPQGRVELALQPGPDETMGIALVSLGPDGAEPFDPAVAVAREIGAAEPTPITPGTPLAPGETHYTLQVGGEGEMRFPVDVPAAGRYALFTQHFADEFQTVFRTGDGGVISAGEQRIFKERFGQIELTAEAVDAFGVQVETVGEQELTARVNAPARVAFNAERMAHVGSAVEGRVAEVRARLGDAVAQGSLLLVVESPELGERQSTLLAAVAAAESARPAVELSQQAYERARALYDETEGGISLTEVQRRQSDLAVARATLSAAEAHADAAANALLLYGMNEAAVNELSRTRSIVPRFDVRAPIAGQVVERDVTPGELVGPDDPGPLMIVADLSRVWVFVDVPEARLGTLGVGARAVLEVPALPGASFTGEVTYVEPRLNEATRTARLRLEVPNPDGSLRPGMFARAVISPPAGTSALAVPAEAVVTIDGRPAVFVPMREKPNTFLKRPVTLGERAGGMYPVLLGLEAGERVVTAGAFVLKADLGKSGATHDH